MQQKSELPEGWAWTTIENITIDVKNIKPENEPNRDFKYIDISSIDNRKFSIFDCKKFKGIDAPSRARRPIKQNDVLFSNVRTYLKNIAIVPEEYDGQLCSTGFTVLRPSLGILPKYLFIFVQTNDFIDLVTPQQKGSQYPATSDKVVKLAEIPISPLPEQHRIVSAIEVLFTRLDTTNEKLDRVTEILKKFRQSVLAAACDGRLTEVWREENQGTKLKAEILDSIDLGSSVDSEVILDKFNLPDTWKWTTVDSIGHVKGGKRFQKGSSLVNYDTSYPYLRAGNLKNGTVEGEILYLQQNDYNQISKYTISSSDVYITIVGACIGDSGIVPEEYDGANLTENAAKVCDLRGVCNQYLALVFKSKIIQDQIQNKIFSASQGKLALSRIRQFLIPLPPLPEQQEIFKRVDALFTFADSIEAKVTSAREKTEKLRQSILAKAFSGELVPTEAEIARREGRNYQAADVLLKKIKEERRVEKMIKVIT